ncbi:hypothetical protein [Sphingomonas nostoxanthinifaciens]|uniref:hypothetical protein n=1 Tax=Sphingomonas nostoxanthinifaciens TaxID=2872652 RepID=UPI001CC20368|nr:hypothetical protein [Sphingomonas nostoxanthinifaciens]UAK26083.1 hypothetical protein K8P63_08255 [Sphingomonas nostoxanthinifaciens]
MTLAKQIMSARTLRKRFFMQSMFDEHAWDILLILYIAAEEGYLVSKHEIADITFSRLSMLENWLNILQSQYIIVESAWPHPHLELTQDGRGRMRELLLESVAA